MMSVFAISVFPTFIFKKSDTATLQKAGNMAGKNGLLITRENEPRIRLAAVFTDIENLPFAKDNPYAWTRDYCEGCNLCVHKCPADAIFMHTKTHADGGPVYIDHTKCAMPFSNDNGCTLCIKYCPFSYGDYNHMKASFEASQGI
jgi:epoxyqueuosine reductase QueG